KSDRADRAGGTPWRWPLAYGYYEDAANACLRAYLRDALAAVAKAGARLLHSERFMLCERFQRFYNVTNQSGCERNYADLVREQPACPMTYNLPMARKTCLRAFLECQGLVQSQEDAAQAGSRLRRAPSTKWLRRLPHREQYQNCRLSTGVIRDIP